MDYEEKQKMWKRRYKVRQARMKAAKAKGDHTQAEWKGMVRFFDNHCVRCGKQDFVQPDHIVPISEGGSNGMENLQPLCARCNTRKGFWDIVDYRPDFCKKMGLTMPKEWILV